MKKGPPSKPPKPRHVWAINPKTRIKESRKRYVRKKANEIEKDLTEMPLD